MDLEKIKSISIIQVLNNFGINPDRVTGNSYFYRAWNRNERSASLKVDISINRFYDHGIGKGGSVIDIVMLVLGYREVKQAIEYLSDWNNSSFQSIIMETNPKCKNKTKIEVTEIRNLIHPALISYLSSRRINLNIAREYCTQIHYSVADKNYFGIGFKNDLGGYEIRSGFFKGATSPKNFTSIKNGKNQLIIFEGFMNFLSYLTMHPERKHSYDFVILNSVSFHEKMTQTLLEKYTAIFLFLDNDNAGKNATNYLLSSLPNATDCSSLYEPFNDVNEWLTNKK
ncbi:MAG: hypothetical protein RL308_2609 [Bacteroidota bacterium]|jgi:hypothetical protein